MATPNGGGFWDFVKNPKAWRRAVRRVRQDEDESAASPAEIPALIEEMYNGKLLHSRLTRLRKAGSAVVGPMLAALRDRDFALRRYGSEAFDGSVLETALDLLEPFAPPELVEVLEPLLRESGTGTRKRALYALGQSGLDGAIPLLRIGLADPDEDVLTWTLMGLGFLHKTGRGSPRYRAELFEATAPVLADERYGPAEHAPRVLLILDYDRAVSMLTAPEVLRADREQLRQVLKALGEFEVPVPEASLRELLPNLRPRATDFPFDGAYGQALILLARAAGPGAVGMIEDALAWGNDSVREYAGEALSAAAGVKNAWMFAVDRHERTGVSGMTAPQLHYLTLAWLDAEVKNGGFTQFFFNSTGNLAPYAVAAAEAVGATRAAVVIRKAVALFGPDGPSPKRARRQDQLSRLSREQLRALDGEYYDCGDNLGAILPLYVARNADHFR